MHRLTAMLRRHGLVLAAFAILTLLMTWPLVTRLGSAFPSFMPWTGGDPNMYIWWTDWVAKALTGDLPVEAGKMLFYPNGIAPLAGYDGVLMLFLTVPITLLSGNPLLAYNIFLLVAVISAAVAAYALVLKMTGSRLSAVLCGFAFSFSPYMLIRLTQHPNLVMTAVIPILLYATIVFVEKPTFQKAGLLADAVLLTALSSSYYLIGGLILIAIAFTLHAKTLLKKPGHALTAVILIIFVTSLYALPMLFTGGGGTTADISFVRQGGAHPLNLILPHPAMNAVANATAPIYRTFPSPTIPQTYVFEATSYLGLLLLFALFAFRQRKGEERKRIILLGMVAATFTVLALGTGIAIAGYELPLPFALLRKLPLFSLVRVPNRFFVYALTATTVLAGFGLAALFRELRSRTHIALVAIIIAIVLAAERIIFPFPLYTPDISDFHHVMASDSDTYAIVDLPIIDPGFSDYDQLQTTHGKPIVDGEFFYPAYTDTTFDYLKANPLLVGSMCDGEQADPSRHTDRDTTLAALADDGIRYVIVHNLTLQNFAYCEGPKAFIRDFFRDMEFHYTDGVITVYRVGTDTP